MRKLVAMLVFSLLIVISSVAFANLRENKENMQAQYGEYRLVIDTDNQLWTRADWEEKGYKKAKANAFTHSFSRQGVHMQMEVMYDGTKPDSLVQSQRFTPDMAIKVKEFKLYFPEVYELMKAPKAQFFASKKSITKNFQEHESPVSMGMINKELIKQKGNFYYEVLAFNIQDEGRLIKEIEFINEDTYIKEFTIERHYRTSVNDAMNSSNPDWKIIKNYF